MKLAEQVINIFEDKKDNVAFIKGYSIEQTTYSSNGSFASFSRKTTKGILFIITNLETGKKFEKYDKVNFNAWLKTKGVKPQDLDWGGKKLSEDAPDKYSHIDFVPPKGAKEAAEKAIEWKKKYGDEVKGGTEVGWKRASQLASGIKMSPKTIRRMHSFFSRHKGNEKIDTDDKGTPWKDNGRVAWLIWGGDAGATWAEKVVNQMNKADEE